MLLNPVNTDRHHTPTCARLSLSPDSVPHTTNTTHNNPSTQATTKSDFPLAERCAWESGDLSGLLLLYTSLGDADGMLKLATRVRNAPDASGGSLAGWLAGWLAG